MPNQGKYTIVKRDGGKVYLLTDCNELWLTRRVKQKKDSRRRRKHTKTVRYIPIQRIPKTGDWLFTCKMEPVRFGSWLDNEQKDFETTDGSHHSKNNCSLSLISNAYAEFFNKHKLWELYDIQDKDFEKYEQAVRCVCEQYRIRFEGI